MFQALVVASFRWALGAVVPSQGILKALRVQGTTLMVWLLGLACHRGWYSVEMLSRVRHVAKLWHRAYASISSCLVIWSGRTLNTSQPLPERQRYFRKLLQVRRGGREEDQT